MKSLLLGNKGFQVIDHSGKKIYISKYQVVSILDYVNYTRINLTNDRSVETEESYDKVVAKFES